MTIDHPAAPQPGPLATALACAALLICLATLSYTASLGKSATWDEPEHLLGSYLHTYHHDFRVNPEDPALFGWMAALPLARNEFKVDLTRRAFTAIADDTRSQWPFIVDTLYRTGGNHPDDALRASRRASLAVGVILGATIAWWTFELAGGIAAIIATALFAFDPNFLGHASIVKNDVMLSAAIVGLMFALWKFGRRGTWLRLAAVAVLAGAAISVKYSGVLAPPFVLIALLTRALMRHPWDIVGFDLDTPLKRLAGAMGASIIIACVAYGFVWMCYGFRFAPTPDPNVRISTSRLIEAAKRNEAIAETVRPRERVSADQRDQLPEATLTQEDVDRRALSRTVRAALWLEEHKLMPQAWIAGFLYTYQSTQLRSSFLLGEYRVTGWWYFFPLAMLFKTPLATLVAATLALFAAILWKFDPRAPDEPRPRAIDHWAFACLTIAPAIYGFSALTANLNLGLRHVLPIYPFIFIATGVVLGGIFDRWRWIGRAIVAVLLVGLCAETVRAYPNYIAFFNTPAGGSRGGLKLLGDSNLDWGQDLKLLATWQKNHSDRKLYLSYFGVADPASYGINATHLPGGWPFAEPQLPDKPGVVAVSATNLQGIYTAPEIRIAYDQLRAREPIEVLGGTIYLYEFPLPSTTPAPH